MALTLYGSPRSRTMRTLWMLAELRLEFTHIPLEWDDPTLKTAGFLALNPAGAIPTLVDDGVVVAESMAINLHLAKRHGDGTLYPADPQAEAEVWRWSLWAQGQLEPWVQRDARLAALRVDIGAATQAEIFRSLAILEQALVRRPWLAADHFTVADLNVAGVLSPSRAAGMDLSACPRVTQWLARCYGRPAALAVRRTYS
jgi:glutathione S-transferase